jgi:hypothetical protein
MQATVAVCPPVRVFSQVGFLWLVTYFFRVSAWSVLLVIGCGFPCRT